MTTTTKILQQIRAEGYADGRHLLSKYNPYIVDGDEHAAYEAGYAAGEATSAPALREGSN